jgi:hypothetical protein
MLRLAVAFAVAAAIPAVAAASPIEITAADPLDVSADTAVSSSDGNSETRYFSLQLGDRYLGRTDESLAIPEDLKLHTVTGLPFGTLQLMLGVKTNTSGIGGGTMSGGGAIGTGEDGEMTPNPEPASMLLLGTGLAALAARRRRGATRD